MKHEVGKFYKNKETNSYLCIVGKVDTTMWGEILVGESPEEPYGLVPIDGDTEAEGWVEITKEDWMSQFTEDSEDSEKLEKTND